jgi:hypothetical protein
MILEMAESAHHEGRMERAHYAFCADLVAVFGTEVCAPRKDARGYRRLKLTDEAIRTALDWYARH